MGDFDFLSDDGIPVRQPDWHHEPQEHRTTEFRDKQGRAIGFLIERSVRIAAGKPVTHTRWVSVTKDGEWQRNDDTRYFDTREEAEVWVEKRIHDAICRYAKQQQIEPGQFNFSQNLNFKTRAGKAKPARSATTVSQQLSGCGNKLIGCGCLLVLLSMLLMLPFVLGLGL